MTKLTIKSYKVEIFKGYYGDDLFISQGDAIVYSARCHRGDAMNRARAIIKERVSRAL
jgi:hypothetical protein